MELGREADLRQLCRICAADVNEDAASHSLICKDGITTLGEKFMSCLGIKVEEFLPAAKYFISDTC